LCEGVNTGIRSSSAVNAHNIAGDSLKRALDVILDRVAMRLALPASERRAVISDDQFQSPRHGEFTEVSSESFVSCKSDARTRALSQSFREKQFERFR
jgi:hypothetical protein